MKKLIGAVLVSAGLTVFVYFYTLNFSKSKEDE